MGLLSTIRSLKSDLQRTERSLLGIIDFSYQHYALGDVLTSEVKMAVAASENGCEGIDLVVTLDPHRPSANMQSFVNSTNYLSYLEGLVPAFLCTPNLRSIKIIRDRMAFNHTLESYLANGLPTWPPLKTHLSMKHIHPVHHADINAFHSRHGTIPQLPSPLGYDEWAKKFLRSRFGDRIVVVLNPRQAAYTAVASVLERDAPLSSWFGFLQRAASNHPEIQFVLVGSYAEFNTRMLRMRNVYVPRAHGLNLGHELALLRNAHMFVGTSSGFSAYVSFTPISYIILNMEDYFASHAGISVGARHYPFASPNQAITWERETMESLLTEFETIYERIDGPAVRAGWMSVGQSAAVACA